MSTRTSAWWSLSKRTIFASPTPRTTRHTAAWWKTYGECVSIGKHISNALKEELEDSTVANFATVQQEGGRQVVRQVAYYNLDMIISVGYRRTRDLQLTIFKLGASGASSVSCLFSGCFWLAGDEWLWKQS